MQQTTPMLREYEDIKRQHPGALLFFRLGDFYELFFEDAVTGARELEITLTARHKEKGNPVPMCGVPYHAASGYIAKLIRKGYRVAICEQTEAPGKHTKLERREVVRIITPGTAIDSQLLEAKDNNYLGSVFGSGSGMAVSFVDLSTGEFVATEFTGDDAWSRILEQLDSFGPREIIFPKALEPLFRHGAQTERADGDQPPAVEGSPSFHSAVSQPYLNSLDERLFSHDRASDTLKTHFGVSSLDGFGLTGREMAVTAAGAALQYIRETQKNEAGHITGLSFFEPNEFLILDS